MLNDLRYSWRALLRNPIVAAVAIVSVAAAIAPNTAMFSIMDQMLLSGSLSRAPDSLLELRLRRENTYVNLTVGEFRELSQSGAALSGLVASRRGGAGLRIGATRQPVLVQYVTPNFFTVLNIRMSAGRAFSTEAGGTVSDTLPLVISHSLWQRQFAGATEVVGSPVFLNHRSGTIVGVAERGFRGTAMMAQVDVWVPLDVSDTVEAQAAARDLDVLALPRRDVDAEQALRLLESWGPSLEPGWTLVGWRARADEVRARRFFTFVALSLCGLVLVVACLNVSTILLARVWARRRELAVRLSLGAGRWSIFRLLLAEGLLIAGVACVAGVVVAWLLLKLAPLALPSTVIPLTLTWSVSIRAVLYTLFLGLGTALLFALASKRHASDLSVLQTLRTGSDGAAGRGLSRFAVLIVVQIAISQALLGGAATLIRSYHQLGQVPLGFDPAKWVLCINVGPVSTDPVGRQGIRYHDVVERITALPGVVRASATSSLPLSGMGDRVQRLNMSAAHRQGEPLEVRATSVGHSYFRTMGTTIIAGRDFGRFDQTGPSVVIANEELVRRVFPDVERPSDALDRSLQTESGPLRIIGVTETGKYSSLRESAQPHLYELLPEWSHFGATLLIETSGRPDAILPAVRDELRSLEPDLWIVSTTTLERHGRTARYGDGLAGAAVTSMGLMSLALATVGLAGLSAFWVRRRTLEIGIRQALGATRSGIIVLMTRQALWPVVVGIGVGLFGAYAISQLWLGMVQDVAPFDSVSLFASGLLSLVVTISAIAIPVTRAAGVDPMLALRSE